MGFFFVVESGGTSSERIGLLISGLANCLIFLSCEHGRRPSAGSKDLPVPCGKPEGGKEIKSLKY